MYLAKAAVASHLAGAAPQAAALEELLRANHPDARAVIAGRQENLAAFVAAARRAPSALAAAPLPPVEAWTCPAGAPASVAVMPDCDAPPLPLWGQPADARMREVAAILGLAGAAASPTSVSLEAGRVAVTINRPGWPTLAFDLPPLVHPLAIGDRVICRREDEVVALSLAGGRPLWQTSGLPMYQAEAVESGGAGNPFTPLAGDMGRYTLSAGGGMVYTVCRFRRVDPETYRKFASGDAPDSSTLAALALGDGAPPSPGRRPAAPGQGPAVAWEVGNGRGDTDLVRQAKYLTAPTYHDGRLFALAKVANRYHAVCLEARTGAAVWETPLGPIPTHTGEPLSWQAAYVMEILTERAGPPAVADGHVYLTTNAGLVVALEAGTGRPVWTYQYDSQVSGRAGAPSVMPVADRAFLLLSARGPLAPVNPVVVAGGRVLCLPADSDMVLALDASTGALLWQTQRAGQDDLTAIDDERLLLSGPDLIVLRAAGGPVLKTIPSDVAGRPAVTRRAVIASGRGALVRLDLATYAAERLDLEHPEGLLGRLISADGKLLAVNAAGASAYFTFDDAWKSLTDRLAAAARPAERFEVHLQRGRFALRAGRLEQAAEGLRAAEAEAPKAGADAAARVRPWLYRLLLAEAQACGDDARAVRCLTDALSCAPADADRADVLMRLVRHHEAARRPADAVAQAQALAEKYGHLWMQDPGSASARPGGAEGGAAWARAEVLGQREIARLIRDHGRPAYAAFDRQMDKALEQAAARKDAEAMLAAAARWPHAARAGSALHGAAEMLYGRALAALPPDVGLAARASRALARAAASPDERPAARPGNGGAVAAARAAQALIDLRLRPDLAPVLHADLKGADPAAPLRFADFEGTVGEVAARLARAARAGPEPGPPTGEAGADFSSAPLPLAPVYAAGEAALAVLRDTRGRPLRIGENIVLHGDAALLCLDSHRDDYAAARRWTAAIPAGADPGRRCGHLSADRRRLAVVDARALVLLDTVTGRVIATTPMADLTVRPWSGAAADGDWLVVADEYGTLAGVNVATGRKAWTVRVANLDARALRAEGEVLMTRDTRDGDVGCWDIRTGRSLLVLSRRERPAQAALTPDGLLVVVDAVGTLRVLDPRRPAAAPLGQAALGAAPAALVGLSRRFAAVSAEPGVAGVRVLDLADLGKPISLALRAGPAGPARPVWAAFAGERVYVLSGAGDPGGATSGAAAGGKIGPGGPARLRAPAVTAYALPSGKALWTRDLAAADEGDCLVSAPEVGLDAVSVLVTPADPRLASRHLVIAAAGGAALDCAASTGETGPGAPGSRVVERAPGHAGSPVILNGRVLVERSIGILLLRSNL